MKRRSQTILTGLILATGLMVLLAPATQTSAVDVFQAGCGGSTSAVCGAATQDSAPTLVTNVINMMLYVLGMVAVIMIIIGGIRYATANGDPSTVKAAKDTVLYSVIGLVVAIMAWSIVNFVVTQFTSA